jgi:hypothetical protein
MNTRHLYLFTVEIDPLTVGTVYDTLPSHCTLMFRFWSSLSSDTLAAKVKSLFDRTASFHITFGGSALLGPNHVAAILLEPSSELKDLHARLYRLLAELDVEYIEPTYVGDGYKSHVSEREGVAFVRGKQQAIRATYLIEVGTTAQARKRIIRAKFELKG